MVFVISAKLFLILYECVLVCTCTQGLIKKLIFLVCHFCDVSGHIRHNCRKLKFKHSMFQSRIYDDISPAINPYKLFHIFLKKLSLLACERNLQDFSLSQKIGIIPQIHSASNGFSPTKPKTHAIWVRKDSLR